MFISLEQAIEQIQSGKFIAVPTETVYGLAASIEYPEAIKGIFEFKNRPLDKPLIVHISEFDQLKPLVSEIPKQFDMLRDFWPGPLTIVFKANTDVIPEEVHAGTKTVAVRIPSHDLLRQLIDKTGPLAAPSANKSGFPAPITAEEVEQCLGQDFPVLDGGECPFKIPSTLIQLTDDNWQLIRAGAIDPKEIQEILG